MPCSSPEAVFRTAQEANAHGEWETFFGCLSTNDLKRLAGIGIGCVAGPDQRLVDLAVAHGASARKNGGKTSVGSRASGRSMDKCA